MNILKMKKTGIFLGGVLLGTVGVKILSSDCVKKSCTKATAGALKVKDSVLETTTKIQENMEDILAEAKEINELEELSSSKTKNVQEDTKVVQETIKDENVQTVEKNSTCTAE
ncbi:hypothetical protein IC213_15765 [Clostridioides sp. ES-S-0049-02]|uniref:DUF6110 family protein n=1 Tax=Clostridioides sp. ES-S-0049-02 TaxID=2770778 RepID=UPI001D1085E5|nr:hypothetical protein [Clostridioides sp. ES-S-0049-02]